MVIDEDPRPWYLKEMAAREPCWYVIGWDAYDCRVLLVDLVQGVSSAVSSEDKFELIRGWKDAMVTDLGFENWAPSWMKEQFAIPCPNEEVEDDN